jgi:hypothetical protein
MWWKVTCVVSSAFTRIPRAAVHTVFWHFYPNVVFVECIPVGIESPQLPIAIVNFPRAVHGGILLMSEHHSIAGLAFPRALLTLSAYRFRFIALQFTASACLTCKVDVSKRNNCCAEDCGSQEGRDSYAPSRTRPHCLCMVVTNTKLGLR